MNITFTVNIAGYGFTIDDDAYRTLRKYLDAIHEVCRQSGDSETASDIEQRIGELLSEGMYEGKIISLNDVEYIISRIGNPEEIVDVEIVADEEGARVKIEEGNPFTTPPPTPGEAKRKLFRDPRNEMLGGVCSGIACYFNIDPVWVRLITVGLFFLSSSTIAIVYIILWIVIPAADTPLKQMQMMGMKSTVGNVGKVMREEFTQQPPEIPSGKKKLANTVTEICGTIAKVIFTVFVIIALVASSALLLAAIGVLIGSVVALLVIPFKLSPFLYTPRDLLLLASIAGSSVAAGVPLFMLVRSEICYLAKRKWRLGRTWTIILWVGFALGLIVAVNFGIMAMA